MGFSLQDAYHHIQYRFRYDLEPLKPVVAAYFTVRLDPPKIHVWTLLDVRHETTENALARAEYNLMTSLRRGIWVEALADYVIFDFDFTTIHLRDRDPRQFIPEGARPIKISHADVLQYFEEANRA